VKSYQAVFAVAAQCRVLGVSSSGYHAWRTRPPSDRSRADVALTERIRSIHERSWGTYGTPRVHAELSEQGERVSRKRVARLMKEAGLQGVSRRRPRR
jgi:putative transposase